MNHLTKVHIFFEEKKNTSKLVFGDPDASENIHYAERKSSREIYFKPNSIFALELWTANEHGTTEWRIYILRSVWPGEKATRIPCVTPGAEILLYARGKSRVRNVLAWLRRLQKAKTDFQSLPADYYRQSHFYIKNNLEPEQPGEPYGAVLDYLRGRQ